jgi:hypothetical protein
MPVPEAMSRGRQAASMEIMISMADTEVTRDRAVQAIYQGLPYSEQIENLDTSVDGLIKFDWRGYTLRVYYPNLNVYEQGDGVEIGGTFCTLIEKLIKRAELDRFLKDCQREKSTRKHDT